MRVTHSMMVNNISYWVAQQSAKLNDAQTEVGSGKKVNKPSDDPLAAGQIMSDRATISQSGQYESNILKAETWIEASSAALTAVQTTLQNAGDMVSEYLSGGTSKETSVTILTNYYNQVLYLANSKYTSGYMYAGNLSNTMPFANEVNIASGVPANIVFDLSGDATTLDIQITNSDGTIVRNITIPDLLNLTAPTAGTNTIIWNGLAEDGTTILDDGQYSFTVTALNGSDPVACEYSAYRGDNGGKEILAGVGEKVVLNNNGGAIFSDILSNIYQAIAAINATTPDPVAISNIRDALQLNRDPLESKQVELASAGVQLKSSSTRLAQLLTNTSNRISDLEIGSMEEAAIKLQAQHTTYEEVIAVTANILKMPKLTDYM